LWLAVGAHTGNHGARQMVHVQLGVPALTTFYYTGMHELKSCDLLKITNTSLFLEPPSGGHESKMDGGPSCEVDQSIEVVTAEKKM
jgi:hypothetical protein